MAYGFGIDRLKGIHMSLPSLGMGLSMDELPRVQSADTLTGVSAPLPQDDEPASYASTGKKTDGMDGMPRLVGRRKVRVRSRM